MPSADPYRYVYVEAHGSAREVHPDERDYLEKEFRGGDGAAPYIKSSYEERNGWGDLSGYLERSRLPALAAIAAAPKENPNRALNRAEYIAMLRGKGMTVVANSDGSFSIREPRPDLQNPL